MLAVVALVASVKEWAALSGSFSALGPAVVQVNALSLVAGYAVSRAAGMDKSLATAISFDIGVHNSTLATFFALSVLGSLQLALPAAVYWVSMYLTAALFGAWLARVRTA